MVHVPIGIIERAQRGDRDAFRQIVEAHQSFVYAVAYRLVHHPEDAEDLTQEAFIRLWKNLGKYNQQARLSTWLYTIVTHVCLDFLKSASNRQARTHADLTDASVVADSADPEQAVHHHELAHWVLVAADGLAPKQKAAFVLRDLEGLPVEEVCSILNLSPGNLKSNLHLARKAVQEKLKRVYATS